MSYNEIKEKLKKDGFDCPCNGTDNDGNMIIISEGSCDGNHYYEVHTVQKNNWIRVNCYYEDGSVDETFEF